jgi:DNA polymerase-3 subunit epsilon
MRVMGLDVETTGLPEFGRDHPADGPGQPRVCSIAAGLYDEAPDKPLRLLDTLIVPDGWNIGEDTRAIHGLTDERCAAEGRAIADVLAEVNAMMDEADMIVGHNVSFDLKLLRGELRRAGHYDRYGEHPYFCTMWLTKKAFGLKKTPKLTEAVQLALGVDHPSAHRALTDMMASVGIYFAIRDKVDAPKAKFPWIRDKSIPAPVEHEGAETD